MEEKLKRELRKLSYKAKKLRGEFEKENNIFMARRDEK
jgi:hypothetical protein